MGIGDDLRRMQDLNRTPTEIEKGVKDFIDALKYCVINKNVTTYGVKGFWRISDEFIEKPKSYVAVHDLMEYNDYGITYIDFTDGMIKEYSNGRILDGMYGSLSTKAYKESVHLGDYVGKAEVKPRFRHFDKDVALGIRRELLNKYSSEFKKLKVEIYELPCFNYADVEVIELVELPKKSWSFPTNYREDKSKVRFTGREPTLRYIIEAEVEW